MGGSSGSSTPAGGSAPTALLNAENRIFTPLGYPNATGAANQAYSGAGALGGIANAAYGSGANAMTAGQQTWGALAPYASSALQTGFDPQQALYQRTQQQVQDQTNSQNAMSGVASTPYGAAVADQANSNFNIDWQNQQLQRQQTGAQTAEGLLGAGTSALNAGTSANQAGFQLGSGINQQAIADFLAYLSGNTANSAAFTGATNNTYAGALGGAGLTNQAQQQNNAGTLAGLSGLGSLFGAGLKFLA